MIMMLKSKLKKQLLMVAIAIVTVVPGSAYADDTEVFLGAATGTVGVKPNVLFILDTSGSMGWRIGGGDNTIRMVAMKSAMTQILSSANNLNIGLMTFSGTGGPVRLPIRDIDAPLDVTQGYQVVRNIVHGADDAQEVDSSATLSEIGAMKVSDSLVYLTEGPAITASTTTLNIPIKLTNDQVDEHPASGRQTEAAATFQVSSRSLTGMRFQNVNVPQGADVVDARLRMRTSSNLSTRADTLVTITGEATDNAGQMLGRGQVNARLAAGPTVSTQDSIWASGIVKDQDVTTENLESIIDEIVARPGWASGNSLALFLTSPSSVFEGYTPHPQNTAEQEPELTIEYVTDASAVSKYTTGLRFQDVRIPQGARVTEAYISVKSSNTSNKAINMTVQADLSVDAPAYSSSKNNISNRIKTAAIARWDLNTNDEWLSGERYFSSNIANVVQEVVNQNGWCGGNALALSLESTINVDARQFYTFEGAFNSSNDVPTLHVRYTTSGISPGETGCTLASITKRIEASEDDVEEATSNQSVQTNSVELDVGKQHVGLRFNNITLPQGAKILSANIEFIGKSNSSEPASAKIHGEDMDNAPPYTGTKAEVSDRIKKRATSAQVDWSNVPAVTANAKILTPDISNIVKEIVARPGWTSGSSMGFMLEAIQGERQFHSYNLDALRAPRLIINAQINLTASSVGGETVRDQLISEVNSLVASGGTPITDVLYEGIQYFRGDDVDFGKKRGNDSRWARVSHPDSYTNGTVSRDPDCTDANLNHSACAEEEITGMPHYISPLDNACQANYIVLLTDGSQNTFFGEERVRGLTGVKCENDTSDNSSNCGYALAEFAQSSDLSGTEPGSKNLPGNQHAAIYSIGFTSGTNATYMEGLAERGGG